MKALYSSLLASVVLLAACSESKAPQAPEAKPVTIEAPAGRYQLDATHAGLVFSVQHLGLSNYLMRFTDYDVSLNLEPDNLEASSVSVTIDPTSVSTDYRGDFKATHPDSPFSGWEEALAQSPKFLNAGEYPIIRYTSTAVIPQPDGTLTINGQLEMLGQTRPVSLQARVVGSRAEHPFIGIGAVGFSATGTFKRSDFGMNHLLEPPLVGDTVTLRFEGEMLQVVE